MTYYDILTAFNPKAVNVVDFDLLASATEDASLFVYGEIHGIRENADVVYTLVHRLGIERIAIEVSPTVKVFIDSISRDHYDFSKIDIDTFDTSILSLEMAKTLAVLMKEGTLREIAYIDTYFDNLAPDLMDHPDSPQRREAELADNILRLNDSYKTLCLMGQWHTQPKPIELQSRVHVSALCRIREARDNIPFIHNVYRSGQLYNDGRLLDLPFKSALPHQYTIKKIAPLDYDLSVPVATRIELPKK